MSRHILSLSPEPLTAFDLDAFVVLLTAVYSSILPVENSPLGRV
jgi:hypothetical protein